MMSISGQFLFLSTTLCAVYFGISNGEAAFSQDTYINALQNSHQTDVDNNSGGYNYSPPENNAGGYDYSPPVNNNYLPPSTPIYGPPAPVYGPPPNFYRPIPYHHDHHHGHWLLEKLKTKINLFTIGKIILKLLIFKKIVKFIGVIFLLLFLPKLKHMFKEDDMSMDEDGMESKHVETDKDILEKRIDELYDFVTNAINTYQEKYT